jgi:hypothetical protein
MAITTDNFYPVIEDLEAVQDHMTGKLDIDRLMHTQDIVQLGGES